MTDTHALPRSIPEKQGVSPSSVSSFLEEIENRKLALHGFMFLRHGHVVAEGWWKPYRPNVPHAVYSLTKSFTSMAVGFAVQEGLLTLEDPILSRFPELETPEIRNNMGEIRIKHLLTMTTGHESDTTRFGVTPDFLNHRTELRVGDRSDRDFVRGFLELPIQRAPGSWFVYNSGASHVLGAIVERAAGVTLAEYLQPRLFDPLEIANPKWDRAPGGGNTGGWGLWLTTEDIARFGQFLLNKGEWNGVRILPAAWIEEAAAFQADNANVPEDNGETGNIDWRQGYGYQFWRCRHNAYRGDGAFGQYCIVMPDQDAVIAMTGGLSDMQGVLDAVWRHLLPSMKEAVPVSLDPSENDRLTRKLATLELGGANASAEGGWSGAKKYRIESNEQGLQEISLSFEGRECVCQWTDSRGTQRLTCGLREWNAANSLSGRPVAVKGWWRDTATFEICACQPDSPHRDRLTFRFEDGTVGIHHEHFSFVCHQHDFHGVAVAE
ncbi:serine hydrolase domain-containing protein [Cohnella caldifontis]|uniref:serine hydrolase domain-containing protein n=1 Tax=Cohnella caldifontis TaxID=3027471 RepID=UPI0023EC5193|nr:serine hydrolase [Cohnella sp. YIM B05605]